MSEEKAEDKPYVVYRLIDSRETYSFEVGSWMKGSGFDYGHLVDALAGNKPRPIVTVERSTPAFANWRFEKLSDKEIAQLECDIVNRKLELEYAL